MTYYQDLTPYEYMFKDKGVLNIGWLSASYPFIQGKVPTEFIDALASLALYPKNICRGFHLCDVCLSQTKNRLSDEHIDNMYRSQQYDLDGRKVSLSNGEIWVVGKNKITYTAPTLIVHYVTVHNYQPPIDFVEAVLNSTSSVFVVCGELLTKIRRLNMRKRYRVCLLIFEAVVKKQKKNKSLILKLIPKLIKLEKALDTPIGSPQRKSALTSIEMATPINVREELHSLHYCLKWFINFGLPCNELDIENKDNLAVERVAMAIEYGFQLGLPVSVLKNYIESLQ